MDVSIVAAIGSFVVSERVIKAKATVLLGLSCVVFYDLTKHSQDPVSLRVYRGPVFIAITLMLGALSLRSWRRNGVACDELLFLPGTALADKRGEKDRLLDAKNRIPLNLRNGEQIVEQSNGIGGNNSSNEANTSIVISNTMGSITQRSSEPSGNSLQLQQDEGKLEQSTSFDEELVPMLKSVNEPVIIETQNKGTWNRNNISFKCFTLERFANVLTNRKIFRRNRGRILKSDENTHFSEKVATSTGSSSNSTSKSFGGFSRFFAAPASSIENNEYSPSGPSVAGAALDLGLPVFFNFHLFVVASNVQANSSSSDASSNVTLSDTAISINSDSSSSTTKFENIGSHTETATAPSIPPQILPVIFLTILMFRSLFPRKARSRFWITVRDSYLATIRPSNINFRDVFVAEVLTSLVRPIQDLFFALFYYVHTVRSCFFDNIDMQQSSEVLSVNLVLHNIVLPTCAMVPLLFRYLQTLREAYDSQARWPHLGNAFKYLTASLVISYGITHPENRRSKYWVISFVVATLYQIWWDIFIDWELLVCQYPNSKRKKTRSKSSINIDSDVNHSSEIEMTTPSKAKSTATAFSSSTISEESMEYFEETSIKALVSNEPIKSSKQFFPFPCRFIQLRTERLYKSNGYYWRILLINTFFRSAWMLAFIPPYHIGTYTGVIESTNSLDVKSISGFSICLIELIRRCWWCILKVELETIRLSRVNNSTGNGVSPNTVIHNLEDKEKVANSSPTLKCETDINISQPKKQKRQDSTSSTSSCPSSSEFASQRNGTRLVMRKIKHRLLARRLFALELFVWATAYVILTLWCSSVI